MRSRRVKVLLINPPVRDFYNTPLRRLPLGLLYVAAALREERHEVSLLDAGASQARTSCPPPQGSVDEDLKSLARDTTPFRLFGRFTHFGPSYRDIEEIVREEKPEAVGISSLFSAYAAEVEETAAAARKGAPGAIIVLGGGHPSALPRRALGHGAVDYIVAGEGERAFPDLLAAVEASRDPGRVPGVALLRNGAVRSSPPRFARDLDALPLPARDLLDSGSYIWGGRPFTQIVSSRGCPRGCTFCSSRLTMGAGFRPRSPQSVVDEMAHCHERFGTEVFDFDDDNLTLDRTRALDLLHLITATFGARRFRLEALNGIDAGRLDRELIDALHLAGFETLHLAPLSAREESLAAMGRSGDLESFLDLAHHAVDRGMKVVAYVMVGFPGQKLREVMETLAILSREPVRVTPSTFYPAPGSRVQKELLPELDRAGAAAWGLARASCFPRVPGGFSPRTSRTVVWLSRLADFCRGVEGGGDMKTLRSLCSGTAAARAMGAPHPVGQPWKIRSPHRLDGGQLGLEALGAYFRTLAPHGVRLEKRGKEGSPWRYSAFRLPGMIQERSFYRRHGIPGFGSMRAESGR